MQMSETTAAGNPPIKTVGTQGPVTGPPTCGLGVASGHVCISVCRAADGMVLDFTPPKESFGQPLSAFDKLRIEGRDWGKVFLIFKPHPNPSPKERDMEYEAVYNH